MAVFFGILVFIVLIVFGVGYSIDSAAHAAEAQAVIEVSKTTQVLAINQLVTTVMIALVLISFLIVIVLLVRNASRRPQPKQFARTNVTPVKRLEPADQDVNYVSFDPISEDEYLSLLNYMDMDNKS